MASKRVQIILAVCMALFMVLGLSQCQQITANDAQQDNQTSAQDIHSTSSLAGKFLSGKHALFIQDAPSASYYFEQALAHAPADKHLLHHSFITHYQNGNLDKAALIAGEMERVGIEFSPAYEPVITEAIRDRDWQALIALADKIDISEPNHILAAGLRAFSYVGLEEPETALGELDNLADYLQMRAIDMRALLSLQMGYLAEFRHQPEEAISHYRQIKQIDNPPPAIILMAASGLWRLGEIYESKTWLTQALPHTINSARLIARWEENNDLISVPPDLEQIIASFILEISGQSDSSFQADMLVPRAYLALSLSTHLETAHLALAKWFIQIENHNQALIHLNAIAPDSVYGLEMMVYKLRIVAKKNGIDAALAEINAYLEHPDLRHNPAALAFEQARLYRQAGDFLRRDQQFLAAIDFYQQALEAGGDDYRIYRNMGISFEQIKQDSQAEAAFFKALDVNYRDSITLNYLGYWWADQNRHLDEAIGYIQRAVELRPESGYYADSLGWAYFRLNAYDDAVIWLEHAIQITPTDPVISDHLGDVYWKLGRTFEARYKWQYAIDIGIDDELVDIIKKKIKNGL